MAGGGHVVDSVPAASEGTTAVAGGAVNGEDGGYFRAEGPVMVMMSKRLRALRKKANRIAQIEEARSNGKSVNKEQEEMLRSKPSVLLLIEEYERIRAPLQASVKEELAEAEKAFLTQALQQRAAAAAAESEAAAQAAQKENLEGSGHNVGARSEAGGEGSDERKAEETQGGGSEGEAGEDAGLRDKIDSNDVVKLVELLYFGALFDVKVAVGAGAPGSEMEVLRWRREQERNSCLSYDVVSDDDATPPLTEQDLDAISALSRLLTVRSPNSGNHREAVQRCMEHVTKYFQGAEEPIDDSLQLSYSQVKDWLRRIVMSEFFTRRVLDVNPEVAAAAAASGQFVSEALPEPQVPEVGQPYTAGEGEGAHYAPQEQAGAPQYYSGSQYAEYVVPGQDRGIPGGNTQHMLVSPVTSFVPHGGFTVAEPSQVHVQYPAHESLNSDISTQSGDSAQQPPSEGGYLPNGVQYTDPSVVEGLHQAQQLQQPQPQHGTQQQQQPQQQQQIPIQGDGMSQVPPGQYMGASRGPMGGRLQNNVGRGYGGRSRGGRIPGRGGRGQYDHQMGGVGGYGQGMYRGGPRGGRVPRGGGRGGSQGWGGAPANGGPPPPVSASGSQ